MATQGGRLMASVAVLIKEGGGTYAVQLGGERDSFLASESMGR